MANIFNTTTKQRAKSQKNVAFELKIRKEKLNKIIE